MTGYDVTALTPREVYKVLIGSVVPRPIAWVSCRGRDGVPNIAPFSYFTVVSSNPPVLGFSVAEPKVPGKDVKDTLALVRQSHEFVVNIPSADLVDELVLTSIEYAADVDEFAVAGLTAAACERVAAPQISEAPVSFECVLHSTVDLGRSTWVMGTVVYAHIRDGLVGADFRMDAAALRPLGRMPGPTFCTELNVVPRAVELADPNAGALSALVWLGQENVLPTPRSPRCSA